MLLQSYFVAIPVMRCRIRSAASDSRALPLLHNTNCFGLHYGRDGYSMSNFGGRKRLVGFLDRRQRRSAISAVHVCKSTWSICSIALPKITASLPLLTEFLTLGQICGVHARQSVPATLWSGATPHKGDRYKKGPFAGSGLTER